MKFDPDTHPALEITLGGGEIAVYAATGSSRRLPRSVPSTPVSGSRTG